ncbi:MULTISPECIES: host cell division inhibitory peptide Kil [Klebsiella pneumoniae complex]|uniref:host cell division inhibitory peptide Kil n=1 Tax=Klebsiella pneumoniae complex TaxID=3390273 RepID=UPI0009081794|nr:MULTISPECIES: host cell division inhibitory peptide Kil [Klebsiella]HCB1065414.1 host cell division inhibitory peptide Kil [Klebsiella variicola subsp. variicola]HDZ9012659.1 host cell division inhibitory peptide Kil [Klebsiella quasipneumoniae subsp. similipneumoniae]MDG0556547.1 host cell division inhibitory peptide Kil [Klebsiella quasipneumoniae]MDP1297927.1 host cell division inhibitory peptide Kil [Klebsiella quasipneumoniae]MEB5816672.1 host cell division inhibitory peptide Kil [Kleb
MSNIKPIDQYLLQVAQSKAAIARYIGDGALWMSAYDDMKAAIGYPWFRRK